ncbi:MAG: preprotein translocase subunit SecG [Deltaproteobacteria bacterium GWA2_38_16]|nr:MAG: preprotein translocase subunit SecG [Deltaproteobacteria bacterium GWA2_38_16]OGQ02624.1 MAG: preprotein translocase subunit SecG [Deltaproteobacteria bacterium RIFCSPHIGHO2_02_FULL_38_15]OGQ34777.1 MAG: preprotein translocase subunit SecG [Deltaproteobacteria bacterium RIFCSPLOWO2_01_FULL_38_9]OGQ61542.1 MAG: preprotein translocase subunit SecG [Deltaproteobacteria bacterium RIFCSPLOWO2_12_FULL_38_8]HBQ20323.1 preprotein translocase subunit SecG [Deltaproteobacteria bacterium]
MVSLVVTLHIIVCVLLILVVLLQAGKGADMGATFGAGSSQSVFGGGGAAPFLTRLTTAVAVIFMITSILLTILSSKASRKSVVEGLSAPQTTEKLPETPEPKK